MERKRRDWPPVINEHVTSLWAEINNGIEVAYSVSKWILIKLWSSVWDSHETWGTSLSALGRVRRVALVCASCSLAANGSRPALMIVWSMKLYHAEGYQNCSALYCVVPNKHAHMSTLVRAYTVWFFWFLCVLFGCCLVLSTSAINCLERPLDARLYSLTIGWVFFGDVLYRFCKNTEHAKNLNDEAGAAVSWVFPRRCSSLRRRSGRRLLGPVGRPFVRQRLDSS